MILVAFVLVLVATVTLIIGTFFDGGTAYIWISIGACVATFGVLAASYFARRRGADDEGARPQPLGAGESRPASVRSAPQGQTVGGGGTATVTRARPETEAEEVEEVEEVEVVEEDEPTVTIVPSVDDETPDETPDEAAQEPAAPAARPDEDDEAAPAPAPRRVAPRVVRRAADPTAPAAEADAAQPAADAPPAWPTRDAEVTSEETEEPAAPAATSAGTRKVVRRVAATGGAAGGTRKVVRRAAATGATRRVVRRAGDAPGAGQRTVKRVVRRAPAAEEAAAAEQSTPKKDAPDRSGTRGKRARAVLSEIKGVGPAKQDALLKRFGSLENMATASVDELADVKGVGTSVAEAIKTSLQDR